MKQTTLTHLLNGVNKAELARYLGVHRSQVTLWCKRGNVPLRLLPQFCERMNVQPSKVNDIVRELLIIERKHEPKGTLRGKP